MNDSLKKVFSFIKESLELKNKSIYTVSGFTKQVLLELI